MSTYNTNTKAISPRDGEFYDVTVVAQAFKVYQELKERGTAGLFDKAAIENAKAAYEQVREAYVSSMRVKVPTAVKPEHTVALAA